MGAKADILFGTIGTGDKLEVNVFIERRLYLIDQLQQPFSTIVPEIQDGYRSRKVSGFFTYREDTATI